MPLEGSRSPHHKQTRDLCLPQCEAEFPGVVEVVERAEGIQRKMTERAPPVERFGAARGVLERGGM